MQVFVDNIITSQTEKGKTMLQHVDATDPTMILSALGHPREHPRVTEILKDLRDGDYAVVMAVERPFGAVYFMRPRYTDRVLESYLDGNVIGAHMILAPPHRMMGEKFLRDWLEERFELMRNDGKDMDGVIQPFFILRSRRV